MDHHIATNSRQKAKKIFYATTSTIFSPLTALGQQLFLFGKNLEFRRDWHSLPNPEWFNHDLDLVFFKNWRRPYFFERGIYASEIVRDKKVLDLCCGDGSISGLFISPLAKSVVAVDFDPQAIKHAKKSYSKWTNVHFEVMDIRTLNFAQSEFDICLWEAAIEHFTQDEIEKILKSICHVVKPQGTLHGHTIKKQETISHHDHEFEFSNLEELEQFLSKYFSEVKCWERVYEERTNFYFRCTLP